MRQYDALTYAYEYIPFHCLVLSLSLIPLCSVPPRYASELMYTTLDFCTVQCTHNYLPGDAIELLEQIHKPTGF